MVNINNITSQKEQIPLDTSALNIIKGRLEPYIYAFRIESFPPSYKIGDTFRGVDVRINEWRNIYSGLSLVHKSDWEWSAMIKDKFFRDHAVHKYLEDEKGRKAMEQAAFGSNHYSSEFYLDTDIKDIDDAITYIRLNASLPSMPYKLYSVDTLKEIEEGFSRDMSLKLRDNQEEVVGNFLSAYRNGRNNLLMYAVMRFGKTFTALCCAQRINAKTVLVVSAKADVATEWKKNVQGIKEFEGFEFFDKKNLNKLNFEKESSQGNTIVLFLTLQDIQGLKIKAKHKKIFDTGRIWDMLIVDESHFGARGPQYGLPLMNAEKEDIQEDKVSKGESAENLDEELKHLKRKVTLHLSGTPYRILMSDEFKDDDLIACVRYPDIIKARDTWFESNIDSNHDDDTKVEEWDNPYFGFPQMIRFAFNLNEESLKIIKEMEDEGASVKFSELFSPVSRRKKSKSDSYKTFRHEKEVLSFLQVIDGTKDDANVLGFLDNERIKQGKLCNHVVMVLPFKASCDSMAALIENNRDKFKNLCDYKIINIAGLDAKDKTEVLARRISDCEFKGEKTLSLTVRKMLTGVTVPEWDTMIHLKETYSPEEYDQAAFRLQNQFIKTYRNSDGSIVKYDMKPQTIFVDFDPQRMFRLQEQKCSIYNSSTQIRGKQDLKDFVADELAYSPIIFLDHHKLRQINAVDLMDEIRKYAQARGIPEEAETIPIDINLLKNEDILQAIFHLNKIDSKNGISQKANALNGKGDDGKPTKDSSSEGEGINAKTNKEKKKEQENIAKKLATYYSLILYFAFLTPDRVTSIKDIINKLDSAENSKIAQHIGLDKNILEIIASSQPWTLFGLNKSINDTNHTSHLSGLSPDEMINIVLKRCNRLSESEIVTPTKIADEMVALLPDNLFEGDGVVLDIASKQGEFAVALKKRYGRKYPEECKTRIYSLCTSGLAYEFTRKTYKYLGFDIDNIISEKTSYDIIANKLADKKNGKFPTVKEILGKDVKINTIIGNPPYQELKATDKATSNAAFASAIYPLFIDMVCSLSPNYVSLITPSRWMTKQGQGVSDKWVESILKRNDFSVIHDFPDAAMCFPSVEIKGGINYFLLCPGKVKTCEFFSHNSQGVISSIGKLDEFDAGIVVRDALAKDIISKVIAKEGRSYFKTSSFASMVSPKHYFDRNEQLSSNWKGYVKKKDENHCIKYYLNKSLEKCGYAWISKDDIPKGHQTIALHKIYLPMAGGTGNDSQILGIPFYGEPNSVCSYTYLVIGYDSKKHKLSMDQCLNVLKYIKTRFFRYMVSIKKKTQNTTRNLFQFVPMQDFSSNDDIDWSKNVEEIDNRLYEKYALSTKEITFIKSMIKKMD